MTATERAANLFADVLISKSNKMCEECGNKFDLDGYCVNKRCINSCIKDKETV